MLVEDDVTEMDEVVEDRRCSDTYSGGCSKRMCNYGSWFKNQCKYTCDLCGGGGGGTFNSFIH